MKKLFFHILTPAVFLSLVFSFSACEKGELKDLRPGKHHKGQHGCGNQNENGDGNTSTTPDPQTPVLPEGNSTAR